MKNGHEGWSFSPQLQQQQQEGGEAEAAEKPAAEPISPDRAAELSELGKQMRAQWEEDNTTHRWGDRDKARNVREGLRVEPRDNFAEVKEASRLAADKPKDPAAKDTSAQPGGTEQQSEEVAAEAKKEADKKEEPAKPAPAEEKGALARKHERELRARDRLVEESRGQLTALQAKYDELNAAVEQLNRDPLGFLTSRKVNLAQLAEQMVSSKDLPADEDPRDSKIKQLEAAIEEIRGSKRKQEEQETEQQEKRRVEANWRAAAEYVVTNQKDLPFINAIGSDAVKEAIQNFEDFHRLHPEEFRRLGDSAWKVIVEATEQEIREREQERHSRLSKLIGGPASAPPAGDGQKKPAAANGQKRTQGSTALSSDGSTPFRGSTAKPSLTDDEDLDDQVGRIWQQRQQARAKARSA